MANPKVSVICLIGLICFLSLIMASFTCIDTFLECTPGTSHQMQIQHVEHHRKLDYIGYCMTIAYASGFTPKPDTEAMTGM